MIDWKEKLIKYLDETHDFLLENAPSFFGEIVAYGRAWSLFCLIGLPIIFLLSALCVHKSLKERIFEDYGSVIPGKGGNFIFSLIGMIFMLISFLAFICTMNESLMCWFAPKLYILKQLTGK